ncbi:MAG TPA: hypothetical protein VLL08_33330 [Kineosporiaceae bacterium]|nr:hypothetical protein [Kineosporiaceae bacterium]
MTVPTPDRPKPETPPSGGSGVTPPRHLSDPVIYDENGRLRIELPHPPDDHHFYPVSGAVLQGYVDQVNQLRAERDLLQGLLLDLPDTEQRKGGWCLNHRHAMTYTSEHGGYWYCDITGNPRWPVDAAGCCDLHGTNCEPPSDLCCRQCTEAAHPHHPTGVPCVLTPEGHG